MVKFDEIHSDFKSDKLHYELFPVCDDEGDEDEAEAAEVESAVVHVLAEVEGGEEGFGETPGRLVEDVPRQVEAGGAHGLAHCCGCIGSFSV